MDATLVFFSQTAHLLPLFVPLPNEQLANQAGKFEFTFAVRVGTPWAGGGAGQVQQVVRQRAWVFTGGRLGWRRWLSRLSRPAEFGSSVESSRKRHARLAPLCVCAGSPVTCW